MTRPWVVVAGDLTPLGGMDAANHALARRLGERGDEVHVVAHRAWPDLRQLPSLTVHEVWRPFGRHLLGGPLLAAAGRRVWQHLQDRGGRAVVNGGNCQVAGANWVHYVHAAYAPQVVGSAPRRARHRLARQQAIAAERRALQDAAVVICNSVRTRRDVVDRVGVPAERVAVVYYGTDPARFSAIAADERAAARARLGLAGDRPLVGFIGALGDRRKAFDTLFAAWRAVCRRGDWDAHLLVIGAGAELAAWQARAAADGLAGRITFLGFRGDVPRLLAALDALVHPARYEAYGLAAHEAICRGVPTIVSATAGVAERYPADLADLLIANPDDEDELAERLRRWRRRLDDCRAQFRSFGDRLRVRTWDDMADEIVALVTEAA